MLGVLATALQDSFGVVIVAVVGVSAVVALVTFVGTGRLYDQIGRGGLSINDDPDSRPAPSGGGGSSAERDAEIRQLLTARNERRTCRGEETVDVEAELARLTAPTADAGLREEVRQLVVARNDRRVRQGKPPLDVDAEVERQLRDLSS